jgi:phage recombination protein Bet
MSEKSVAVYEAETGFTTSELALITDTVAKGASKQELALFLYVAGKRGLNPLARQIHWVKRGDQGTIQTGIDGLRLIAERTGKYAPSGKPTQFEVDKSGKLISATVYGNRIVNGTAFEFSATAHFDEYAPKMPNGQLFPMWVKMPRTMLEKCAEAKMLRKGFPEELSGLYSDDEMQQADAQITVHPAEGASTTTVTDVPVGEVAPEVICPTHGVPMRKNKWGGYSHVTDETKDGKAVWCNIKAKDLENPPAPTNDSPAPEKNAVDASQGQLIQEISLNLEATARKVAAKHNWKPERWQKFLNKYGGATKLKDIPKKYWDEAEAELLQELEKSVEGAK